ncbi:MAG: CbiX/SirB N-terminal domain-containing protein [Gammaproteobacteria bacterium]|nr:CbiX/SirB N-terminal domain-containing protein [Gammaproteobacteria bacterium]
MKRALIVVSHGSRREASNEEVRRLSQQLSIHQLNSFDDVSAAFLELAEPSIPDGVAAAIERGADEVTVLPYFLSAGRHVTQDIPAEVDKARRQNQDAVIRIAPYIGRAPEMADIVLRMAEDNQ